MPDKMFENLPISKHQIKIFLGTFVAMFTMVSLQYLGIHFSLFRFFQNSHILSPVAKKQDIFDSVRLKLERKTNSYQLKKGITLIDNAYAASDGVNASAYAVVDFDSGEVLAEKNAAKRLPIASLTKIMTAIVALDLASPSEVFTITPLAASMPPTKLGVSIGTKMTLEELLNASLLTSANDAAEAIRDGMDAKFGDSIFIRAMNDKAVFLGLHDTHFTTPQGFDYGDNFSTAFDLTRLAHYALSNYPLIAEIVKKDYQYYPGGTDHTQLDLYNWNGLLGVYPDIQGMKIGNTKLAGKTTIVLSNRGGKKILADILGAPEILERDIWAAELLDLGYQRTLGLGPVRVTEAQLQAKYATWQ